MSVELKLKIPALEQLLKISASGIDAVAGPMLARWQARAQSDALRIEAKGKADAIGLIASAQSDARDSLTIPPSSALAELDISREIRTRLTFQEEKRQRNIETVVRRAAEDLGDREVPNQDIDHDWTAKFFADVQDVSSDQMQGIWAKILAGEVEQFGATSIQTLSVLKTMSQRDANLFQNITPFVISDFIINDKFVIDNIEDFPTYSDLLRLSEHGLLHIGMGLQSNLLGKSEYHIIDYDVVYHIFSEERHQVDIRIPTYIISSLGREICRFTKKNNNPQYIGRFSQYLQKKKMKLASAQVLRQDDSEWASLLGPWEIIEPRE